MKFYKRYLSVLCVFVLLFGLFSFTANAEEYDNYFMGVELHSDTNSSIYALATASNINGTYTTNTVTQRFDNYTATSTEMWYSTITFRDNDNKTIIKADKKTEILIDNLSIAFVGSDMYTHIPKQVKYLKYSLTYADGTQSSFVDVDTKNYVFNSSNNCHSIKLSFTPDKDVKKVHIREYYTISSYFFTYTHQYVFGALLHNSNVNVNLDIQTKEQGLLDGILGWVKNIFNKIEDTFNEIKGGFSNVVNSLLELPSKLWNLISDGLKSLFVPDEEYMSSFSDKWDELLSQRFGAIYQVGDIITDFVERIQITDKTNTIYMPEVSLNSVGIPFSFGGYDVKVVPDGFNTIVEVCKKILSIVCTFLFINGLRKKYDEVMGVEQ